MKIKVSEASGSVLDYMVAKCEEVAVRWSAAHEQLLLVGHHYAVWQPHKNWSQGGPIIEREIVSIDKEEGGKRWAAFAWRSDRDLQKAIGPTPLIAAMRCYLASKLGNEVEVPEELV